MVKQRVKRTSKSDSKKEPWFSKTTKIVSGIIGFLVLGGMIWGFISNADARYAKDQVVKSKIADVENQVAVLGKAFQYDQLDRAVDRKQDLLIKIELRLKENISPKERIELETQKRQTEFEIQKLKEKQQKLD
jgi:hypothetical protein